jgi:hypothetical protein
MLQGRTRRDATQPAQRSEGTGIEQTASQQEDAASSGFPLRSARRQRPVGLPPGHQEERYFLSGPHFVEPFHPWGYNFIF